MISNLQLLRSYFDVLRSECFSDEAERIQYDGVLKVLHDIPFYWTVWSDENRAGDALTYRQSDFLSFQLGIDYDEEPWLHVWALSAPSVLEVFLGIARRWNAYFEGSVQFYFAHLFINMGFDQFPGEHLTDEDALIVRQKSDDWMSHQFQPNGIGSPFALTRNEGYDMRQLDIWGQMNAYSVEHFQ